MRQLERNENEVRAERRRAAQWLRRHEDVGGALPPRRRLETGEGAAREHTDYGRGVAVLERVDGRGSVVTAETNKGSRPVLYDGLEGIERFEADFDIHALSGFPPRTGAQVALDARIAHVLSFLRVDRAHLLRERFMWDGGYTLASLAAKYGVSRQAISKRLKYAVADFAAAYDAHLYDPIEFEEEEA